MKRVTVTANNIKEFRSRYGITMFGNCDLCEMTLYATRAVSCEPKLNCRPEYQVQMRLNPESTCPGFICYYIIGPGTYNE